MLSVSVHPLAEVTVTVYVPGAVTVALALVPNPLSQLYVPPPVAVMLIDVVVQVNSVVVGGVMPAVGAVRFCVIVMLSVSVQPLAEVTVTVYVPGAVTVALALVPNPLSQLYVPPPVAVKLIDVVVQVNSVVAGGVIPAVGTPVL